MKQQNKANKFKNLWKVMKIGLETKRQRMGKRLEKNKCRKMN